jgi:uncharacterized SAM-binding protein YcdF (DUF218 family)
MLDDGANSTWSNNQSAMKLAQNHVFHDKTKHFEVDWHVMRQKVELGEIMIEYIPTSDTL